LFDVVAITARVASGKLNLLSRDVRGLPGRAVTEDNVEAVPGSGRRVDTVQRLPVDRINKGTVDVNNISCSTD
jgi:hypothetical protein